MKKINKLWVMKGSSWDRGICFEHVRIKANVEGLKTTKIVFQMEEPFFKGIKNVTQYYINEKQLEDMLNKYSYDLDLKVIVNQFNSLVDAVWEEK